MFRPAKDSHAIVIGDSSGISSNYYILLGTVIEIDVDILADMCAHYDFSHLLTNGYNQRVRFRRIHNCSTLREKRYCIDST